MSRNRHDGDGGIVWSSDGGTMCPACGRPRDACICRAATSAPSGDGVVRVTREVKGRRGKAVTVVRGLPLDAAAMADLARDLKRACGTGGSVKAGAVEIQGEKREQVAQLLRDRGFTVKIAGG